MDDEPLDHFLKLLDDSQLVAHINSLSQAAAGQRSKGVPDGQDQIRMAEGMESVISSYGSDPFNDNLDSLLLKLDQGDPNGSKDRRDVLLASASSSFEVHGNQLAAIHSDNSTDEDSGFEMEENLNRRQNFEDDEGSVQKGLLMGRGVLATSSFNRELDSGEIELKELEPEEPEPEDPKGIEEDPEEDPVVLEEVEDSVDQEEVDDLDVADTSNFGQVGAQHKFGDFETYFENKHRKQQLADQHLVHWEKQRRLANGESSQIPAVFKECTIFVNGNTVPSMAVIHKLVVLHGGLFLHHLSSKSAATHIVCDKLTPKKRVEFRNFRVVRAKWITDCVELQQLLDWKEYRLIEEIEYDQRRLGFSRIAASAETNEKANSSSKTSDEPEFEEVYLNDELDHNDEVELNDEFKRNGHPQLLDNLLHSRLDHSGNDQTDHTNAIASPYDDNNDAAIDHQQIKHNEGKIPRKTTVDGGLSQFQVSRPKQAFGQMDAKHPEFLAHFFANSRLHHLSTWKADLKSKFIRLVANRPQVARKDPAAIRPLILHIDFDCFFATVSALKHPELDIDKDPIAVSHGGKSSDIASCNYVARKKGIRNGLWLGNALTLCPNLNVIGYDFDAYERVSHAFYTYLISCNSFDKILPVLIDEALVDVSSYCSEEDLNVDTFLQKIRDDVKQLTKCSVSIGASQNVLLAKLATRCAKPNGHFHLHENIDEFLSDCNLQSLPGVGYGLCKKLSENTELPDPANIYIRDIKGFSTSKLINVLGEATGMKIYNFCRGFDPTSIDMDTSSTEALLGRKSVSVEVNFGIRFDTFPQVETFLMNVAKELQHRMISLSVCGSRLSLKLAKRQPNSPINPPKYLGMGKVDFFSRSSNLGVPTNDWGFIGSEMKALCRSLNIPPQELRGVGVTMSKLVDSDIVRKEQQQKLQFKQRLRAKLAQAPAPAPPSQSFPFAEKVVNSESIDWDVFNLLPDSIKQEFKKELLRRGIPVSSKEKRSTKNGGGRVFHQQLFPSQPFGSFKSVKVIESPKKKRRTRESPTKAVVSFKEESPTPYNETISYDEEVLNEIPSSIRNELLAECERRQKDKRLAFVSMREKLDLKDQQRRNLAEAAVDTDWLRAQRKSLLPPIVPGMAEDYMELVLQLKDWIKLSLADLGPHPEDIALFEAYIRECTEKGMLVRATGLIDIVAKNVKMEAMKLTLCKVENQVEAQQAIEEWKVITVRLKETVRQSWSGKNAIIEI